jgi:hypothetical protein
MAYNANTQRVDLNSIRASIHYLANSGEFEYVFKCHSRGEAVYISRLMQEEGYSVSTGYNNNDVTISWEGIVTEAGYDYNTVWKERKEDNE